MFRSHITVSSPVVLLALVGGLLFGVGFGWFGNADPSHGVQATAAQVFDVGVAEATAAEPAVDVPVTTPPPVVPKTRRVPARPRSDESTVGPGTASILRRKRGEYAGRLIPIDRTSACVRVAKAYFRMRADAQRNGVRLYVESGFRTRGHQKRLYRELGPHYAAPPGKSLHRRASELDIAMRPGGGDRTHRWLTKHGGRYGFVQRYSWEPWHWGFVKGC